MDLRLVTVIRFSLVIFLLATAAPAGAQFRSTAPYESQNAESIARSLLSENRYAEAASYLELQLKILPTTTNRLPLMLLLADAQLGQGYLDDARQTLTEAESLVAKPSNQRAIESRSKKLAKLQTQQPVILPDAYIDTSAAVLDLEMPQSAVTNAPITNSFFETDLRQVLTDLSMEAAVPILWDATVQGLVTYEAKEQPLENVLKAILLPMGYTFSFQDGAYFVGSAKPEDPAFGLLSKTAVVTMANLDATEAIGLLSEYFKPYVKASKTANLVCITAPPNWIERIKSDLATLDLPPDQILIEVIVTEINKDALREIGIDWSLEGRRNNPIWNIGMDSANIADPSLLYNYTETALKIGDQYVDLTARLEALEQSGKATIRANPRITTMNGRTAQIAITKDQYFIIQTGSSQYYQYNTLQSVSSGIKLEITPFTAPSGEITVYVKPEVGDVVGKGQNDLPEISKRSASTSVRVRDGQTFTIGGLSLQADKNTRKKVPFLGDIPILGYLFRYDKMEKQDTEIVIFVTPHILKS